MSAIAELLAFGLCCPRCKGNLRDDMNETGEQGTLTCEACNETYPVLHGIPDLRVAPDPYIGIEADRAKGARLAAHVAPRWEDLAAHYYDITLDTVPPAQARLFAAGLQAAQPRAAAALEEWERLSSAPLRSADALLDVGCGTAPLLAAVGTRDRTRTGICIGIDVAFRWLVVGKRRLANAGVQAHLVCACAEALPFRDECFDVATSQATLENVRDQAKAMTEMFRVLQSNGRAWISTANKHSLGPDPHLGIVAGGLLPDAVAARIARSRGALPPERQLLTRSNIARLLHRASFSNMQFSVPAIPAAQREAAGGLMAIAATVYEIARRQPVLRAALLRIGPTLLVTARPNRSSPSTDQH